MTSQAVGRRDSAPQYYRALREHARCIVRPDTEVDFHGLKPETYAAASIAETVKDNPRGRGEGGDQGEGDRNREHRPAGQLDAAPAGVSLARAPRPHAACGDRGQREPGDEHQDRDSGPIETPTATRNQTRDHARVPSAHCWAIAKGGDASPEGRARPSCTRSRIRISPRPHQARTTSPATRSRPGGLDERADRQRRPTRAVGDERGERGGAPPHVRARLREEQGAERQHRQRGERSFTTRHGLILALSPARREDDRAFRQRGFTAG